MTSKILPLSLTLCLHNGRSSVKKILKFEQLVLKLKIILKNLGEKLQRGTFCICFTFIYSRFTGMGPNLPFTPLFFPIFCSLFTYSEAGIWMLI